MILKEQSKTFSISVVIPAYNAGEWLRVAVESVLAQKFRATEIIVVDDGSKDNTAQIACEYPQVTYIRQDNAGASAARNHGVREAHGDWIAFLDADDYWYQNRLADTVEIIQANPELRWCAGVYEEQDLNGRVKTVGATKAALQLLRNNQYFDNFYQASLAGARFHTDCMTIQAGVFRETGYFDETLVIGEDIELWCRIADQEPKIGYVSKPSFQYIRKRGTLTTKNDDIAERFKNSVLRYTNFTFYRVVEQTPDKAFFFRQYVFKALRHSLRTGNGRIVREIIQKRSSWIKVRHRVFFYLLSYIPKTFLQTIGNILRHIVRRDS